jgi:two-component system response regulator MprA
MTDEILDHHVANGHGAASVLVVDDDPSLRSALRRALEMDRYRVEVASDGHDALDRMHQERFDVVVLDVNMPKLDGLETCRRLRDGGDRVPILMLTARDAIDDRVDGLEAGADDYLVKPFALRELKARLKALLRRSDPGGEGQLAFADLTMDLATHDVHRGGRRLALSQLEFQLLQLFLEHPRQVLTRSTIFERVWGYDFGATSNALGVYIGYLRRKTEEGGEPRLIHTVRGVGYILRDDA